MKTLRYYLCIGESLMSNQRYTPEFKEEAIRQIVERNHPMAEVAKRLGVPSHSLYKWIKAVKPGKNEQQTQELNAAKNEILKLRSEWRRAEEEREILKRPHGTLQETQSKAPVYSRTLS